MDNQTATNAPEVREWELNLVERVASGFRTNDREELIAELSRQLIVLKTKPLEHVRKWPDYLARFLRNRAIDWIEPVRAAQKATLPIAHLGNEDAALLDEPIERLEREMDACEFIGSLSADERELIDSVSRRGNTAAAQDVQVHRNTIRNRLIKARERLLASTPGQRHQTRSGFVAVPNIWFDVLLQERFTLVELKVLLWAIRYTIGWNRMSIRTTWYGLAAALRLDRAGVFRAGKRLVARHLMQFDGGSLALQSDPTRWALSKPLTGINGDFIHRKTLTRGNVNDDRLQPPRGRPSPDSRRAKDSSKDRKTIKYSVWAGEGARTAGAAAPVPGKYDGLA